MLGTPSDLGRRGARPTASGLRLRSLLALAAFLPALLRVGWREPVIDAALGNTLQLGVLGLYLSLLALPALRAPAGHRASAALKGRAFEAGLVAAAFLTGTVSWPAMATLTVVLILYHLLRLYLDLVQTSIPPGLVFVGSFVLLSIVGTAALMLPAATPADSPKITLLEASFTIVSAISQTGLILRDTGTEFTRFGQTIILVWIQVGGLGVIVFGALLATVFGSNFGLRAQKTIAESTEQGWSGQLSLTKLVVFTMLVTHGVEAVGAAMMYYGWPETWPGAPVMNTPADRWFHAVFTSVSGFCNAGFSTTANSMEGLRSHWTSHLALAPVIVLGSIGFPVLDNLRETALAKIRGVRLINGRLVRLNLNTKIVLSATLVIYVFGVLMILIGEMTQARVPLGQALLDGHFMTINRSCGFDTVAPGEMGLLSQLTLILLMFVGGSPGSVAGGIKLMVFSVLALTVWSTLTGRKQTEAFGRTLQESVVRKSATLITLSLATVMTATGVLAATESAAGQHSLDALLFEATSAFGCTGLTMGITSEISDPGKMALMGAMFIGRVGPLAVLAGLLSLARGAKTQYAYPTEDVVIY